MQWLQETWNSINAEAATSQAEHKTHQTLQSTGTVSKEQLLRFFAAGEAVLKDELTRRSLKDANLLKQDVGEVVTGLQRKTFEEQGIEGKFGVDFLGKISTIYKSDNEVMAALLKYASLEEDALDEAEMSDADYAQKQRLMELAKAHTAQLMTKLETLPAEERQGFLQDQMRKAEELRRSVAAGEPQPTHAAGPDAMSQADQLNFFSQLQRQQ